MNTRFPTILLLGSALGLLLPLACSSKKPPEPVTPTVDAGVPDAAPMVMGDAAAPVDSGAPMAAVDAGGPVIPPTLGAEALDAAIDIAIKAAAAKDAPGMTAEGQPLRATLAENGTTSLVVTLSPGRCYTVIGFSPTGQVTNLDLKLMAPPYTIEAGRSGASDKNLPIIGRGKNAQCPVLPIAIGYRVDARATKGTGRIGLQVFSKSK